MVNTNAGGHIQTLLFGALQSWQGEGRRNLICMVFCAGHLNHREITFQPKPFRHSGDRRDCAQRGKFAGCGGCSFRQAWILRVANYQSAQLPRIC